MNAVTVEKNKYEWLRGGEPVLLHGKDWREKQAQVLALPKFIKKPGPEVLEVMQGIDSGKLKFEDLDGIRREQWIKHLEKDFVTFMHYHATYRDRDTRKWRTGSLTPGQLVIVWWLALVWLSGAPIRGAILKTRRMGASYVTSQFGLWVAEFHENRGVSSIANDKDTSRAILRYCNDTHKRMPKWMRPPTKYYSKNQMFFEETDKAKIEDGEFGLQSFIDVQSVGKDFVGTGADIQVAMFSEAGKYDKLCDPDDQFTSTTNTIPEQPETAILLESTAHGDGTWWHVFWQQCMRMGTAGWNLYTPIFLPWFFDPRNVVPVAPGFELTTEGEYGDEVMEAELYGLTNEQMQWRRIFISKQRGDDFFDAISRFRQEFPASPEEAWRFSSGRFVPPTLFESIRQNCLFDKKPIFIGDAMNLREEGEVLAFDKWARARPVGPLRIWEMPQQRAEYLLGCDVSSGQAADMSCMKIYRRDGYKLHIAAEWYGLILVDELAHLMWRLGHFYNTAMLGWERTGPGLPIAAFLRKGHQLAPNSPYPSQRMFRRPRIENRQWTSDNVYGVETSRRTKRSMMDNIASAARDGMIQLLPEDLEELGSVAVEDNGALTTAGLDRLMAATCAAWVGWLAPRFSNDEPARSVRSAYGSLDWMDEVMDAGAKKRQESGEEVLFRGE
jgi:hypothetical protein